MFSYDKLDDLGSVLILLSGVFGFLPNVLGKVLRLLFFVYIYVIDI